MGRVAVDFGVGVVSLRSTTMFVLVLRSRPRARTPKQIEDEDEYEEEQAASCLFSAASAGRAPTMTVRKATMSDATRLAELSEVLGYPVEPEVVKQRVERLLSRPENVLLVADLAESGVAGWIHAAEKDILEAGRSCEILGLVVAANQRNHGIGRRLVERVEQWAVERGLTQISVRSNVLRTESHQFYERLGYARTKTQHAYRKRIDK